MKRLKIVYKKKHRVIIKQVGLLISASIMRTLIWIISVLLYLSLNIIN